MGKIILVFSLSLSLSISHSHTCVHTGMIKNGFGHVINISSIWGKAAPSNRSAYSSAKFGLIALMDSIRYEVAI